MTTQGNVVSTTSSDSRLDFSQLTHDTGLSSIEKLDGNSICGITWKCMVELYIIHEDLWEYTYSISHELLRYDTFYIYFQKNLRPSLAQRSIIVLSLTDGTT